MKLSGKVKQLIELKFSKETSPATKGNDAKFELSEKTITKFNSEGNIKEVQTIYPDYPDSLSYLNLNKTIYIYDKNTFLLKFYNTTDSLNEKRFEYDERGNLTKVQWFANSIALVEKSTYKYDQRNLLIEENEWDTSTVPKIRRTHTYDDKGYKRESNIYKRNKNGQLDFDSKNNYVCDNTGRAIESISFYRNELATKSSFLYNNNGNLILKSRFNSKGVITDKDSSTYEYDHINNWIKRMDYSSVFSLEDFILSRMTQRIIEYY